jgi:hypothetical protein
VNAVWIGQSISFDRFSAPTHLKVVTAAVVSFALRRGFVPSECHTRFVDVCIGVNNFPDISLEVQTSGQPRLSEVYVDRTLRENGVQPGSILYFHTGRTVQHFVKDFACGRDYTIEVCETDTIAHVKLIIHQISNLPPSRQRLTVGSKPLQNERTLADYHFPSCSRIYLMGRNDDC